MLTADEEMRERGGDVVLCPECGSADVCIDVDDLGVFGLIECKDFSQVFNHNGKIQT